MVLFQTFFAVFLDTVQQKFTIGMDFFFLPIGLVLHECGHAVVGALLGVRSTGIRFGEKPVFTKVVRGYSITVGWLPTSGHTTFVDERNFPQTWQVLATYLAGPLAVFFFGPVFFLMFQHSHLYAAALFGALFSFNGIYDLRANCPDGIAIRRLWKVLRAQP